MATSNNQLQAQQKPKFSVAITTKGYQSLISNTPVSYTHLTLPTILRV